MSKIIAISREFGSGGHIVGEILADRLAIPYYDNELITLAAEHGGIYGRSMDKFDEKKSNPFLFEGNYSGNAYTPKGIPMEDVLFKLQAQVIRRIAKKGNAIIIGRCANEVLKEEGHTVINVFISAPMEERISRIMKRYEVDYNKAVSLIRKKDKRRKAYYRHHTGMDWGKPESYDYFFQTKKESLNQIVDKLVDVFEQI